MKSLVMSESRDQVYMTTLSLWILNELELHLEESLGIRQISVIRG